MVKFFIPFTLLPFFLGSCQPNDDAAAARELEEVRAGNQELSARSDALSLEIKELKAAGHFRDQSGELAEIQSEIEKVVSEQPIVEEKIKELEKAVKKAERDLEDYRNNYRVRSN